MTNLHICANNVRFFFSVFRYLHSFFSNRVGTTNFLDHFMLVLYYKIIFVYVFKLKLFCYVM